MSINLEQKVSLRTAYLIMYRFICRYWHRGQMEDELTDLVVDIGPIGEDQTQDPAQIHDWLAVAEEVLAEPNLRWSTAKDRDA